MTSQKISVNPFCRRQTAESKYSHFLRSENELVSLAESNFSAGKKGYMDGVLVVTVPADKFFSGVIEITSETPLKAEFKARRKKEEPYLSVVATGRNKLPAKAVELVLYRHDVLEKDGDASSEAEWEIVSLNARPTKEPEPQTPVAMARNFLGLAGGTKGDYSAKEFAEAIQYWSTRCMCG